EQPGGGAGLDRPGAGGGTARRVLDRPLAPAAAGAGDPGRPHHPGHLLPHPVVRLLPPAAHGRHLWGVGPDAPDREPPHRHLGHDRLLRGRAGRAGGRLADRRLHLLRQLLAGRAAAGEAGVVATGILAFVFSWNNFLFSVILAGRQTRTLPIAVFNMISYEEINWGTLAAAATMITLPVLVLALIVQRHIVTGLTFGAVKQ